MKIIVERSGGFAGIPSSSEMDSDRLPPSLEETVRDLLAKKKKLIQKNLKGSKGSDYFIYRITLRDGSKDQVIECNEVEMDNEVKSLVRYIKKNSEK